MASTVLPAFDVPSWMLRAIIIALALGFVPALMFAWVFELTPGGVKRDDEISRAYPTAPQNAQSCIDGDVALITRDRDFSAFEQAAGLKLRGAVTRS